MKPITSNSLWKSCVQRAIDSMKQTEINMERDMESENFKFWDDYKIPIVRYLEEIENQDE